MPEEDFRLPPYAVQKLTRHGHSVDRLVGEIEEGRGEFAAHSFVSALSFDAADFAWAALMAKTPAAQTDRAIRNRIAEAMIQILSEWDGLPQELRDEL